MRQYWPRFGRDLLYTKVQGSILIPGFARWRVLRAFGMGVERCTITPGVTFTEKNISIGRGAFVNYGCYFDAAARITIEDEAFIGMHVRLLTSGHEIGPSSHRAGKNTKSPIRVGRGSWIGAGSLILPGVTIGDGCVVAGGSVVTKSCEPHCLYAGVPARFVRNVDDPNPSENARDQTSLRRGP